MEEKKDSNSFHSDIILTQGWLYMFPSYITQKKVDYHQFKPFYCAVEQNPISKGTNM